MLKSLDLRNVQIYKLPQLTSPSQAEDSNHSGCSCCLTRQTCKSDISLALKMTGLRLFCSSLPLSLHINRPSLTGASCKAEELMARPVVGCFLLLMVARHLLFDRQKVRPDVEWKCSLEVLVIGEATDVSVSLRLTTLSYRTGASLRTDFRGSKSDWCLLRG